MPSLLYRINDEGNWKKIETSNKLYALKGAKASFKPDGGDSGEVSKTFDTIGETNVIVTTGGGPVTATIVVFSLTPVVSFDDNFQGRSTTNVGVCEGVTLSVTIQPTGLTPEKIGGLKWTLMNPGNMKSGILVKSSKLKSQPDNDGNAYYTAPDSTYDVAKKAAFKKTGQPGILEDNLRTKNVELNLVVQAGLSAGLKVSQTFKVHSPYGGMKRVVGNEHTWHIHGLPSAGFRAKIYLFPDTVSFSKILFREAGGKFRARAADKPREKDQPGGYFIEYEGKAHRPSNLDGADPDDLNIFTVSTGKKDKGCKVVDCVDTVKSGRFARYPNPFTGEAADGKRYSNIAVNVPSIGSWFILWQYRPVGNKNVGFITFQQVEHRAQMDQAGTVTMMKAGAKISFAKDDPGQKLKE